MNVTPSFKKTTEKKSSFDALALREVYGIIYSAPEQELALADVFQTNQLTITRLSSSETFLPYLPLEENLFIASTGSKSSSSRSFPGVPIRTCLTWSFIYFFYDF